MSLLWVSCTGSCQESLSVLYSWVFIERVRHSKTYVHAHFPRAARTASGVKGREWVLHTVQKPSGVFERKSESVLSNSKETFSELLSVLKQATLLDIHWPTKTKLNIQCFSTRTFPELFGVLQWNTSDDKTRTSPGCRSTGSSDEGSGSNSCMSSKTPKVQKDGTNAITRWLQENDFVRVLCLTSQKNGIGRSKLGVPGHINPEIKGQW